MTSAGETFYRGYKAETEKNNVKPEIISGFQATFDFLKVNGIDSSKPDSRQLRFWDGPGKVFYTADGRVVEQSQTNSAIGTPLLAIFANKTDYINYRAAMPINFYLNH